VTAPHAADRGDFTDAQAALLVRELQAAVARLAECTDLFAEYVAAGGRDFETFERCLDVGIGREATKITHMTHAPLHPSWAAEARAAVAKASRAGSALIKTAPNPAADLLHQQVAAAILMSVWGAGTHHLVQPGEWPPNLAQIVLGAVRQAHAINGDPAFTTLTTMPYAVRRPTDR
jgi:hypothetical protein